MDVSAYYNESVMQWQLLIHISQEDLTKLLERKEETQEEFESLVDNATMRALGY